ncbi:hypothetical protein RHMOL_Rhmol03G0118000 [Rhododendron molle]|uniref:Uncharacterized protein n=1 Tax=Rhododendron molle TaxID=49168 RepID=A0ACC0PFJ5_RHOML|nr:hypothetical protein RHMOL_Rhmol03G0118000 [Rhododendron molle]
MPPLNVLLPSQPVNSHPSPDADSCRRRSHYAGDQLCLHSHRGSIFHHPSLTNPISEDALDSRLDKKNGQKSVVYLVLNVPSVNVVGRLNPVKATGAKMEVSVTRPVDWHLHLRDGDLLQAVISHRSFR